MIRQTFSRYLQNGSKTFFYDFKLKKYLHLLDPMPNAG